MGVTVRTDGSPAKRGLKAACLALALLAGGSASAGAYDDFVRAVRVDDARTVSALMRQGIDPNTPDESGLPPLFVALREGCLDVAETLLAHPDLKVDAVTPADETALMMAALRGRVDWMQRLIARGAAVNRTGWTPLHYAASGPEPRAVSLLLERGAAIEAPSPNRTTALMMSAGYGAIDSAVLLMARGADARVRNDAGLDAAAFARRAGRDALASRLEKVTP